LRVPSELADTPQVSEALEFIKRAYGNGLRRKGKTAAHPIAVAELLAEDGQPPDVVVAGLLHDVLEDTEATPGELSDAFGAQTARVVEALTQNPSIKDYRARKSELRQQIVDAGPDAATVSLADKAAKLRSAKRRPADRKLDHYRETLREAEARYGPSRLSELLREELERWPLEA
jgi:GTP diphosphokinase / guanosine-3',5'-bis(diphosphate) 3'-diphosphatase